MPSRGIHHIDLAVSDVERSLGFYLMLLGPLGWREEVRYPTYRRTEEVVYLMEPSTKAMLGLRPADGGTYRYHSVGVEHFGLEVDKPSEVDAAYARCVERGSDIQFPPEEDERAPGYYAVFVFDPDGLRVEVFCWAR